MVLEQARRLRGRPALRCKEKGAYRDILWEDLEKSIRSFGRGLLGLGVARGERVAIMAPNRPEWVYADLGSMACGALSVPIYHTEGLKHILYILKDSESRFLFIHSPLVAEALIQHHGELPHLKRIVLLEGVLPYARCLSLNDFLRQAEKVADADLDRWIEAGAQEDVATMIYTSGTTGPPKGVLLTHANFLSNIEACIQQSEIGEGDECLSFLPLSHVFERMAGYYLMLHQGAVIAYAESLDTVPVNLLETHPTIIVSVPRMYEKLYARIMERVLSGRWLSKQIFFAALKAGKTFAVRELADERPSLLLRWGAALGRKIIFAKMKERLGGRLRFLVSGGAPLGKPLAEFFMAAGIPIYEGYGLTETSPVIALNTPGATRLGTVGRPVPGTEVRIADDGEILVRGPGVFCGYWKKSKETNEVFINGWFKTGDVGWLDEDGFLTITDRKKNLIITAGGENVAPQNLENLFKTDKYIANAMVYGDRKPYLTALLVPNFDNLEKYARTNKLDFVSHCDLVAHPAVLELIQQHIDSLQKELPSFQKIKRFTLLPRDFSREDGELTPTLKVKRNIVATRFHNVLEEMYSV
jgi:long-chain acyl-CoA synthetase